MVANRNNTQAFILSVAVLGMAVLVHALSHWSCTEPAKFAAYFVFALIASRMKVKLPGIDGSMSVGFLFTLMAVIDLSYPEALVMAAVPTLVQCLWKPVMRPGVKHVIFNVSLITLATAAAFGSYHGLQDLGLNRAVLLGVAGCVYFVLNTAPIALVIGMSEGRSVRQIWSTCYFWSFPYYLVGAAITGLTTWCARIAGWETSLLVLPAIYLIYRSYFLYLDKLSQEKRHVEEEKKHVEEMASLHMRTIEALALAIEAKDTTTHDHLQRVRIYALKMAELMQVPQAEMDALRAAALLHDIGKLGVPEHIINKPGKLSPEEFEKMKIHPVVGAEILERVKFPYPVVPIVRAHHEKWDGSGYPARLKGEQIPIGARILSAVDCLDALASDRQYRRALPLDQAMAFVEKESGKAFDPAVVRVLKDNYVELEAIVQEAAKALHGTELSVDARIEAGAAPDAGFEHQNVSPNDAEFVASIAAARQEAQTLFELSHDLGRSLRLDDTLSMLASRLQRLVRFEAIAVYLLKDEVLVPAFATGDNFRALQSLRVPMDEGLVGWVAANRKPIVNGNPTVEAAYSTSGMTISLQSALAVPLETADGALGVLCIYRQEKDAFTSDSLRVLLAIRERVAMSIENALRFEQAENSATTDFLTGLPNARSLFLHLDRELSRCAREESTAAVLVCDLDGFKQVNDRFGHLEGNRVLKEFADELRSVCRESDYVARMGGDEFVMVLPNFKAEAAEKRSHLIETIAGIVGKRVCGADVISASIGRAFYDPANPATAEQLLGEADRRMYAVKQGHHRDSKTVPPQSTPPRLMLVN